MHKLSNFKVLYDQFSVLWSHLTQGFSVQSTSSGKRPLRGFNGHAHFNSSPPGQNGRHIPDENFKCIFMNERFYVLIRVSLKFVPKGPINNIPVLIQIMAWCGSGDKPLSEPMLIQFTDTYVALGRDELTHRPLGDVAVISQAYFSNSFYVLIS